MEPRQIPSDIDSLDAYFRVHGHPDAEAPDAPHLRGNARVPGGMSGVLVTLPMPHEAKAHLILSAAMTIHALIAEMVDATSGRECNAFDEALVHSEHVVDHLGAAIRARAEALRLAAAE